MRILSRLLTIILVLGSASLASAQSMDTVQTRTGTNGIRYLADSHGMTLYYFTLDTSGQSACSGGCVEKWPLFYAPTVSVSPPLKASDFGTITRADGAMQTTYKGWPLYYWYQDKSAGEMKGEGVGKVWYVLDVPSYTVMVGTKKPLGNFLVDGNGNTLYYFTKDSVGHSVCEGGCIHNWPAFAPDSVVVPSALNPTDFSTITRADGTKQLAFKGYPLYYYVKDKIRGEVTGQGVGGVWYVVDPSNFAPKSSS
jgi:predicted lipoprotein with Yx(FWY)xxD motif